MRARRLGPAVAGGVLVVGVAAAGWHGGTRPPGTLDAASTSSDSRLVMVSGRDDHGMVATDLVPVYDKPEGAHRVARIHDGTLAEVLSTDGQWLQVRTVEGPLATGWVDDFFLRGEVRLVGAAPSCATTVDGHRRDGGTLVVVRALKQGRVWVDTVTPPVASGWAPRDDVQELPPQGAACGDIPPDDKHSHHH